MVDTKLVKFISNYSSLADKGIFQEEQQYQHQLNWKEKKW